MKFARLIDSQESSRAAIAFERDEQSRKRRGEEMARRERNEQFNCLLQKFQMESLRDLSRRDTGDFRTVTFFCGSA